MPRSSTAALVATPQARAEARTYRLPGTRDDLVEHLVSRGLRILPRPSIRGTLRGRYVSLRPGRYIELTDRSIVLWGFDSRGPMRSLDVRIETSGSHTRATVTMVSLPREVARDVTLLIPLFVFMFVVTGLKGGLAWFVLDLVVMLVVTGLLSLRLRKRSRRLDAELHRMLAPYELGSGADDAYRALSLAGG
jgi:hypothetical protein